MATASILRFLNPRRFRREREAALIQALKVRDGSDCARCRRPIRFDFPAGADQGPAIEPAPSASSPDDIRLCHRRCSPGGVDHTGEVTERVRRKNEAALFSTSRKKRRAA